MSPFTRAGFAGVLAITLAVVWTLVGSEPRQVSANAFSKIKNSGLAKAKEGGFKFEFDYSEAGDNFNDEVKKQIEDAGKFLAGYIGGDSTVKVKVVAGDIQALALGAPSARSEDTEEKSITTEGGIRYKSSTIDEAGAGKTSVYALTVHELMHVLGFTDNSKAFAAKTKDGKFVGENTVKMNAGQDVILDGSHFKRGFKDSQGVSPRVSDGGGDKLSILDLAVLADLGYSIPLIEGKDAPPVMGFVVPPSDFISFNINGAQYRMMQGYAGDDTLIAGDNPAAMQGKAGADTFFSGKGDDLIAPDPQDANVEDGADVIVIPAEPGNDTIQGFDSKDVFVLSPKLVGEDDIEKILADKEKFSPDGMFVGRWVLKLGDVTIKIQHRDFQGGGAAPTKDNFKIEDREPPIK